MSSSSITVLLWLNLMRCMPKRKQRLVLQPRWGPTIMLHLLGGGRSTSVRVMVTVRRTIQRTRAKRRIRRVKVKTRLPSTLKNVIGVVIMLTVTLTRRSLIPYQLFVLAVGGVIMVMLTVLLKAAGLRLPRNPSSTRMVFPVTMEETGRTRQAPVIVAITRVAMVF